MRAWWCGEIEMEDKEEGWPEIRTGDMIIINSAEYSREYNRVDFCDLSWLAGLERWVIDGEVSFEETP